MSSETFVWYAEYPAQKSAQPAVNSTKFGDGFEQRTPAGINNVQAKWDLQFNARLDGQANAIDAFLTSMAGVESFYWTAPGDTVPTKWICRSWKKAPVHGNSRNLVAYQYLWDISCTFERVFEP